MENTDINNDYTHHILAAFRYMDNNNKIVAKDKKSTDILIGCSYPNNEIGNSLEIPFLFGKSIVSINFNINKFPHIKNTDDIEFILVTPNNEIEIVNPIMCAISKNK